MTKNANFLILAKYTPSLPSNFNPYKSDLCRCDQKSPYGPKSPPAAKSRPSRPPGGRFWPWGVENRPPSGGQNDPLRPPEGVLRPPEGSKMGFFTLF